MKNYNVSSPSSFINQLLPAVSKLNLTRISLGGCCLSVTSVGITEKEKATQFEPGMTKNVYVDRIIEELKQSIC